MKKLIAKLIGGVTALAMAIGVGVAVANNNIEKVSAETTYEQLTSIASIDGSASYVLGIDGTGFHYSGTSSWGLTALPAAQTPLYYTLTKAANGQSFTAQTTINETVYYLQVPTSNTFGMVTSAGTNTDLIIGTTQVASPNYAVANQGTTNRHLRINGSSGLRSYAGTTGSMAFFYKVISSGGGGPEQLSAPSNIVANGATLNWSNVANNSGYSYSINTTPEATTGNLSKDATSFDADSLSLATGVYSFKIKTKGDGASYSDSDYSTQVYFAVNDGTGSRVIDSISANDLTATNATYTKFTNVTKTSDASYFGRTGKNGNNMQFNNGQTESEDRGIATSSSGGYIRSVSVSYGNANNKTLTVRVSNTPFTTTNIQSGGTLVATKLNGSNLSVDVTGNYNYVSVYGDNGATYPASLFFEWDIISASVVGNDTINAGAQWSGSVEEDESGETIADVTYAFVASNGATITSSSTSNGTFTSSTAGTVTVSATKSGCVIASKEVTVNTVVVPTISLAPASIEGYTGESFSVTATFANLTSAFAWETPSGLGSISGSVTATTGTSTDGTSTYSGTLQSAGSVTLSTSGGGVVSAPFITFTIAQTTVLLNKNTTSIPQAASETLVATTNVGGVVWTSNNAKVTVSESGIINVAADAVVGSTATITATSNVDDGVSASCTVTVAEHLLADYLTVSVIPAASVGADTGSWGVASTFSDYTGAVYTARFMGVSSPSFIGRLNDSTNGYIYTSTVPSGMKLKSVSISSITAGKTVGVYAQKEAYTAAPSVKGSAIGTITSNSLVYEFDGKPEYRAICLRGHTSATEIGTVVIEYEPLTAKDKVESDLTTSSTLSYHYSKDGGNFEFSNVAIRFGGFMTQDLWDELDTNEHLIAGYGVLLTDDSLVDEGDDIAVAYEMVDGVNVIDYYSGDLATPKSVPSEATAAQKTARGVSGNYYIWNLYLEIEEANFDKTYVAGAYIKLTNDQVIFMKKASFSVISLAADYLANRGYEDEAAGGSLYKLAHFGE